MNKLTKQELFKKCEELNIKNYKSKNKNDLINLINNNNNCKIENKSPLRYPGGKSRACKIIDNIILEYFNIDNFDILLSPFFGGGSFELYFYNKYKKKLIVNDKFTPLYNFWLQIKINKYILYDELKKYDTISKQQFLDFRKTILNLNNNTLLQAIQYFIINRCSFSGATLSGGFSQEASIKRYTLSAKDKILSLDFLNIDIYNYDFEEFINIYYNDKSLIFLDPPYYLDKKSKLYGNNGDMHEHFNHELLYNIIKNKKNWILTYNNHDYIKNLYKDFIILDTNWSYGMNKSKLSSEIIIISN